VVQRKASAAEGLVGDGEEILVRHHKQWRSYEENQGRARLQIFCSQSYHFTKY
jgi:hypothetical protein